MNVLSFFSGAGGLDMGFEKAGFDIKLALEFDPVMCETLKENHPKLNIQNKDILKLSSDDVLDLAKIQQNEVDGIIGGSPCQSFSTAGKRTAFADERGQAMLKYIEIINEIKPKFFVLENVRGFLSAALEHVSIEEKKQYEEEKIELRAEQKKGSAFEYILSKIKGYEVKYKVLNSADYGVPQKRERVFVIGILKDTNDNAIFDYEFPPPTHSKDGGKMIEENNSLYFNELHPWKTFDDAINHLKEENMNYTNYSAKRLEFMKLIPKGGGNWKDLKKYGEHKVKEAMKGAYSSGGGKVGYFRRLKNNEPSPTLVTSPSQNSTNLGHPFMDRPLSIEEYLAIQEFPSNYKVAGNLNYQYKQIGNAVPINLAKSVAESILKVLNKKPVN